MIDSKFEFLYQKNIPVLSWNPIPFWEFEEYIKRLNDRNKEENKRQQQEKEDYSDNMPNFNNITKSVSSFKQPSFNMPSTGSYLK